MELQRRCNTLIMLIEKVSVMSFNLIVYTLYYESSYSQTNFWASAL